MAAAAAAAAVTAATAATVAAMSAGALPEVEAGSGFEDGDGAAAVAWLARARGEATAVVSYVIAPGTAVGAARDFIKREVATAVNIKDKRNRVSVGEALRAIADLLARTRAIPDTGLATFAGSCV